MREIIAHYLPETALDYCMSLYDSYPFQLKITKKRLSKLGDYRYDRTQGLHKITLNGDMNPYQFLITYVHEIAHLVVNEAYVRRKRPHGKEWKGTFSRLMMPILNSDVFPDDILIPLSAHMQNPSASSQVDAVLSQAIRKYDKFKEEGIPLNELGQGHLFKFRKRKFEKLTERRTRVLVKDLRNNRNYLISKSALVTKID